jgi:hypothetical protein
MASFYTKSGGLIEVAIYRDVMRGEQLYIHIDHNANIRNGEGEASITLNLDECKDVIAYLNEYVKHVEGKDYVFTAESVVNLLSTPEVQKVLIELGYDKKDLKEELDLEVDSE